MSDGYHKTMTNLWHRLLAWANFCLAAAAVLKFIPIAISLTHGIQLTSAQIGEGLGEERAWALDLAALALPRRQEGIELGFDGCPTEAMLNRYRDVVARACPDRRLCFADVRSTRGPAPPRRTDQT